MPDLSLENIEQIRNDILLQEISFSHLADELIDHVCCDIEKEMTDGLSFIDAYAKVKKMISPDRFREIQKETLYAVDTKYRNMKNLMKFSGISGSTLFGLAALFKIQHWAGAGIMLTLGGFILAFLFLPSALGVLWKETHNRGRLFLLTAAFLSAFLFITGTLFKIQHWPYAGYLLLFSFCSFLFLLVPALLSASMKNTGKHPSMLVFVSLAGIACYLGGLLFKIQHWPFATMLTIVGIFMLCFIALPWYTWRTWKDDPHVSPRFLFIIIAALLIVIPGALVSLNMQYSYENEYYYNQSQQQALNAYLHSNNKSLLEGYRGLQNYKDMEALHAKTTDLLKRIDNVQAEMVRESEGEPGKPAVSAEQLKQTGTGLEIEYKKLSNPFVASPVKDFLFSGSASRTDLEKALKEYSDYLALVIPGKKESSCTGLLASTLYLPSSEEKFSMMSGLHSLELLKNSILTVESRMLKNLAVTDTSFLKGNK